MTDKALIAELRKGNYKPVYLLMGEEDYYIDIISDYFEKHIIDPSLRDFDMTVVYGKEVDMGAIVTHAKRYPMMSPVHLVIVKEAQMLDAREWPKFEAYLQQPSAQTILVFCYRHKTMDKRTKVYKGIKEIGEVYETPKIYDNMVPGWIADEVKANGHAITDKAAVMLGEFLGTDLSKIVNELTKLYPLLKQGEAIDETLVEQQIGISKDYNVFELQNAIGQRDPVKCNRIVNYFADNPRQNPLQPIIGALYSYILKIMFYHQVENKSDAAKVIGCNPVFVKDYARAASSYSLGKLASCIGYLYEADLRSKGVRSSGNVAEGEILKELVFKIIH